MWSNEAERAHRPDVGIAHVRGARVWRKPVEQRLQITTAHAAANKRSGPVEAVVIVEGVQGVEGLPPLEFRLGHPVLDLGNGLAERQR